MNFEGHGKQDKEEFEEHSNEILNLAIKALEQPQGEWILIETDCDDGGNDLYECTNCHYSDIHSDSTEVPYCWHCGAKMKGGAK